MAYYSKLGTGKYHVCKNCPEGNNIERENLREGQPADARLCIRCTDLRSKGNCTPGTPTPAQINTRGVTTFRTPRGSSLFEVGCKRK